MDPLDSPFAFPDDRHSIRSHDMKLHDTLHYIDDLHGIPSFSDDNAAHLPPDDLSCAALPRA